jgi:hypothetical protein
MRTLFNAGTEVVRSELTPLGRRGPYRLTMTHAQGTIVEYFVNLMDAQRRQADLEKLLQSARGAGRNAGSDLQKEAV